MSKQNHPSSEVFPNSLCRDLGHEWLTTTAPNYRLCQREKCRAAERLEGGEWVNARQPRPWLDPLTAYEKRQALPRQSMIIWEAGQPSQQGG